MSKSVFEDDLISILTSISTVEAFISTLGYRIEKKDITQVLTNIHFATGNLNNLQDFFDKYGMFLTSLQTRLGIETSNPVPQDNNKRSEE